MLTAQQKNDIMDIANAYDEEVLHGIITAITDSGIMSDMLTVTDFETADALAIDTDADDFDIMDEQYEWEFRQPYTELMAIGNGMDDMEEVCEHLNTLI